MHAVRWLLLAGLPALLSAEPLPEAPRPWTVEDSIAVRYFSRSHRDPGGWSPDEGSPITWSPRGTYFCFHSSRGDLAADRVIADAAVFRAADVMAAMESGHDPRPAWTATFSSASGIRPALDEFSWIDDERLMFVGTGESGSTQVYQVDIPTQKQTAFGGRESTAVFDGVPGIVVYSGYLPRAAQLRYPVDDLLGGPAQPSAGLMAALGYREIPAYDFGIYLSRGGPGQLLASAAPGTGLTGPWISPDGRHAVAVLTEAKPNARRSFLLFDLVNQSMRSVVPTGDARTAAKAVWRGDSRAVLLVNAAMPEGSGVFAQEIDGQGNVVATLPQKEEAYAVKAEWKDSSLVIEWGGLARTFSLRDGAWHESPASSFPTITSQPPLEVAVVEDANRAPAVVARWQGHEALLTMPDPALKGVRLLRSAPFSWTTPDGRQSTGGLILPPDVAGPVPLVIQAYRYQPQFFRPDGFARTAYAAQALAAAGLAVLTVDIPAIDRPDLTATDREGGLFVERMDAAIEALAQRGVIDPRRVGLVGFSRGGYMVMQALARPGRHRLAAAINADGWTGSLTDYLLTAAVSGRSTSPAFEKRYDGSLWQNRAGWIGRETLLNLDHIRTPLLLAYNGETAAVYLLPLIGALQLNKVPFDALVFPQGDHQLRRPRERAISLTTTVEWMKFWLLDLSPSDPDRSLRWKKLAEQVKANANLPRQE